MYRISFGKPFSPDHETLNFTAGATRGNAAFYQLRAAREIVRVLRTVAPNAVLEVKVSDTEWEEVEVS